MVNYSLPDFIQNMRIHSTTSDLRKPFLDSILIIIIIKWSL